jgi:hypothetical protein
MVCRPGITHRRRRISQVSRGFLRGAFLGGVSLTALQTRRNFPKILRATSTNIPLNRVLKTPSNHTVTTSCDYREKINSASVCL